jgi:DNA polymerase-3 subunit epsilon/CBS domain-containing protein
MSVVRGWLSAFGRRLVPGGGPLASLTDAGFVAIDLETTGLDPRRDAIVSVAVIPFVRGEPEPGYRTLVDPERAIPPESTRIHGITDVDVRGAARLDRVLPDLMNVIGPAIIVGHAVEFDLAILGRETQARGQPRLANTFLDTQRLAAALFPDWSDLGLDTVAARIGVTIEGRHTAQGDAIAAGRILLALLPRLAARGVRTIGEAQWLQRNASMPQGRR